jgi:hypothetical protein
MSKILAILGLFSAFCFPLLAADSALTIYNQDFAVVRSTVSLDLHPGVNDVKFADTTAQLEPSSVVLRDPAGKTELRALEQNYRADPVTQELLLSLFEGQTIDFRTEEDHKSMIVQGKIIRSGYSRKSPGSVENSLQPIIEVGGKLRFELPGTPLFPKLADDTILKPELSWKISTPNAVKLGAELAYITGGMNWSADYNVIAPENGDVLQLVGWVTLNNESGKRFDNARTKLVAGDVTKLVPRPAPRAKMAMEEATAGAAPEVTEKAFDEYHLYTLERPVTLRDREMKQVEFVRAEQVQSQRIYRYDGAGADIVLRFGETPLLQPDIWPEPNTKVAVVREFKNSEANHLGIPLPKGRLRFYRRDNDQQLEFTGENEIDHTPKDETLRISTGNAFDLVGERRRIDFAVDNIKRTADESFEIKLRNHKKEPVEIRVTEHLCRWRTWEIAAKSDPFTKIDAQTIEFRIAVKPDEEKVVSYKVHYTQLPAFNRQPVPGQ